MYKVFYYKNQSGSGIYPFFFSGMLNEMNETKFYYKANDTKKNKKQQDSSYKKIKNPGPTLQCPHCFLEAGSSKESERGLWCRGQMCGPTGLRTLGGRGTRPGSTGNAGRRLDGRSRIRHS